MQATLKELARLVGGTVEGDASVTVCGVAGVREAHKGQITFAADGRYAKLAAATRASAIVTAHDVGLDRCPAAVLRVDDPDSAFAAIAAHFAAQPIRYEPGIDPTAVIGRGVGLGRDVTIGAYAVVQAGAAVGDRSVVLAHCYVGHEARLGCDCLIHPGVKIRERVTLGDRVIVHCGTVIGSDGFGFRTVGGVHEKVPQLGTVEIEDDVEIGANVTIDRARFGATHIGRGTKIDNLVQIAHNVWIGQGCIIVAQAGIAGSAHIGDHVVLAGQCGVGGHLEIGESAAVGAKAGVTKDIQPGQTVSGFPAQPLEQQRRQQALLRRLPSVCEHLRGLHKRVQQLEAAPEDP